MALEALVGAGIIIGGIFGGIGASQSKQAQEAQDKAYEEQKKAQVAAWEADIRAYKFNIGQLGEDIGAIRREGEDFKRGQSAAMGASGATLGFGTPLMNMIRTQAGIDVNVRGKEDEIAFLQEEIIATEENLGGAGNVGLSALRRLSPSNKKTHEGQVKIGDVFK